jgi:hypothetical protein
MLSLYLIAQQRGCQCIETVLELRLYQLPSCRRNVAGTPYQPMVICASHFLVEMEKVQLISDLYSVF